MNRILSAKEIERISKAIGDPYRLKIMDLINREANRVQCAAILETVNLAQSTVSHHIKQLIDADLLITEKEGRNISYQVNKDVFNAYINYLNRFI